MIIGIPKNELDGTEPSNFLVNRIFPQANWRQYRIDALAGKRRTAQLFSGIAGEECFGYCADAGSWESSQ